jgi:hypothetical protein
MLKAQKRKKEKQPNHETPRGYQEEIPKSKINKETGIKIAIVTHKKTRSFRQDSSFRSSGSFLARDGLSEEMAGRTGL